MSLSMMPRVLCVTALLALMVVGETRAASTEAAGFEFSTFIDTSSTNANADFSFEAALPAVRSATARVRWLATEEPEAGLSFTLKVFNFSGQDWTDFHLTLENEMSSPGVAFDSNFSTDADLSDSSLSDSGQALDLIFGTPVADGDSFVIQGMVSFTPNGENGSFLITMTPTIDTNPPVVIPSITALPAGMLLLGLFAAKRRRRAEP